MNKTGKKVAAITLSSLMFFSSTGACQAMEPSTEKEEVVYAVLNHNGKVKNINVINHFGQGDIVDYGHYSKVKNLTTKDKIKQSGDKNTVSTDSNSFYYQGTLDKNAQLPWDIQIKYYLNGKEKTADELAGKKGKLEIRLKVDKNEKCQQDFYNQYAMQATIVLDTKKCHDIEAKDATMANVGTNKQLNYTVLPGQGLDTVIKANVEDFEMDEIDINGILMNMNINIDDQEIEDKMNELIDGTESLYDGTKSLDEGIGDLKDATLTMQKGVNELNSKSSMLNQSSTSAYNGLQQIQKALTNVSQSTDDLEQLMTASSMIQQSMDSLNSAIKELKNQTSYESYKAVMKSNGADIDALQTANNQDITSLKTQIQQLEVAMNQTEDPATKQLLQQQLSSSQQMLQLLSANQGTLAGNEVYFNQLSGNISELSNKVNELNEKYKEFDAKIQEMVKALKTQMADMSQLSQAINQLVDAYKQINQGQSEYTNGVAQIAAGYKEYVKGFDFLSSGSSQLVEGTKQMYDGTSSIDTSELDDLMQLISNDYEVESFVSTQNTNVKSVQFALRTQAIEKTTRETKKSTKEEKTSLWDKFIQLFK